MKTVMIDDTNGYYQQNSWPADPFHERNDKTMFE